MIAGMYLVRVKVTLCLPALRESLTLHSNPDFQMVHACGLITEPVQLYPRDAVLKSRKVLLFVRGQLKRRTKAQHKRQRVVETFARESSVSLELLVGESLTLTASSKS